MRNEVAIRFQPVGKADVVSALEGIGDSGDASFKRVGRAAVRAFEDAEAAMASAQRYAAKLQLMAPGVTPAKADVFAGARYDVGKDAAASAAVFEAAYRKQQDAARALLAAIDPVIAAQQRFDREIAQAKTLMDVGALSTEEYARVEARLAAQLADATGAVKRKGTAFASAAPQIQDLFTQISMGANPINALVVQGGQLAGQLQYVGGKAEAFASVLMGPWGVAAQVALLVLTPLVAKFFEGANAADDASSAASRHQRAVESLTEAVKRLNNAQASANKTTRQGIIDDMNAAEAARQLEIRRRGALDVLLRQTLAERRQAQGQSATNVGSGGSAILGGARIAASLGDEGEIQSALKLNAERTAEAQSAIRVARGKLIGRDVAAANDAATAATTRYEDAVDRLTRQHDRGRITDAAYRTGLDRLTKARDAATDAAQKHGGANTALLGAQGRLAAADTDAQRATAQLAVIRAQANADLKAGTISTAEYRDRIRDAQNAVDAAKASTKSHADAIRDAAAAQREYLDALRAVLREVNPERAATDDLNAKAALLRRGVADGRAAPDDLFRLRDAGAMEKQTAANLARLMGADSAALSNAMGTMYSDRAISMGDKRDIISEEQAAQAKERVRSVADLYRNLMTGGTGAIWDRFKQRGMDVIADLLAQWTMKQSGGKGLLGAVASFLGGSGIGRNATGTEYWSGGMSLVGEHGPEAVWMPRGSRVTPATETRRLLAGGGGMPALSMPVTIHAPGADAAALARVEQAVRDLSDTLPTRAVAAWQDAYQRRLVRL